MADHLTLSEKHQLWRKGILAWKLRAHQRGMYAAIMASVAAVLVTVVHCARQIGKTYSLCLIACETAIQKPGCAIRYAAPTEKSLRSYVHPNMMRILSDCPKDLRPQWDSQDSCYRFPNGSTLWLAGVDGDHIEKLRGPHSDLLLVDECGTMGNLKYVVDDVLTPQTFETDGRIVLIGTSPKTPGHPFASFIHRARSEGAYIRRTIDDNTHLSQKQKDQYERSVGGRASPTFRREALCELVVDEACAVVPEFEAARETVVTEFTPAEWFHPLVAMDVGFDDLHAILFGYWNFERASLDVLDEAVLKRARTDQIAEAIALGEARYWPWLKAEHEKTGPVYRLDPLRKERRRAYRYSDVDPRLLADLSVLHGLQFAPTKKDDKEAQVNALRMAVRNGQVRIHPRCKQTIRHLSEAIWDKARTSFERTDECGHFDCVDALIYMWRNAPRAANPMPQSKVDRLSHVFGDDNRELSANAKVIRGLFHGPKRFVA